MRFLRDLFPGEYPLRKRQYQLGRSWCSVLIISSTTLTTRVNKSES